MTSAIGARRPLGRDLPAVWLRLDGASCVAEANAFAREACSGAPEGRPLADLLVEAQRPWAARLLAEAGAGVARLSFACPGGGPRTFVASAVPDGEGLLLLGVEDLDGAHDAVAELGRLAQAQAHTTRELQKANARLAQIGAAQAGALVRSEARLAAAGGWLEALEREGLAGTLAISGAGVLEATPAWWALHGLAAAGAAPWVEVAARLGPEARAALEAAARLPGGGAAPARWVYRAGGAAGARRVLLVARLEPPEAGGPPVVRGVALDATPVDGAG